MIQNDQRSIHVCRCLKKKNQTAKPDTKQVKQSKTKQVDNPKNNFSQNNMKLYFLNNTENIKDPSMYKYSFEVMFLVVLQPLFCYENKDFRDIYENRSNYASRHGSRQ